MKKKILLIGGNGLVGKAVAHSLKEEYQIVSTAGHEKIKDGYQLTVEEADKLVEILDRENPEIVISSIRGDFTAQMNFHKTLAEWMSGKEKKLLFMSTANVFDGDLSKTWTEESKPNPQSEYGIFKRNCEDMLSRMLGNRLTIFRLSFVWSADCPRALQLKLHSMNHEPHETYPDYRINITFANQIGEYAKFVLAHNLSGIFHIGTTDLVNYFEFEKMVCEALKIELPDFVKKEDGKQIYMAVLPTRKEIPDDFQMTVSEGLKTLDSDAT